jgi:hypothetical protein
MNKPHSPKSNQEKTDALNDYLRILKEDLAAIQSGRGYRIRIISAVLRLLVADSKKNGGGLLVHLAKTLPMKENEPFLVVQGKVIFQGIDDFLDQQILSAPFRNTRLSIKNIIKNEAEQNGLAHEAIQEKSDHVLWKETMSPLPNRINSRQSVLIYAGMLVLDYGARILNRIRQRHD